MVKILGHYGAQSLGFTANTIPAFGEALEVHQEKTIGQEGGFLTCLSRSLDGEIYCVADIRRDNHQVHYALPDILSEDSAAQLGGRRLDECMKDEISGFFLKNGDRLVRLPEALECLKSYPNADVMLQLRGEDISKDVIRALGDYFGADPMLRNQIMIGGYDVMSIQAVKSAFPDLRCAVHFYPENFPKGVKLYPWSNRAFGCYLPYKAETLESPLMRRLCPDYLVLEATAVRENTIRSILRQYKSVKIALWVENEPKPEENFALLERLKNPVISPHIAFVISKYPRQLAGFLDNAIMAL